MYGDLWSYQFIFNPVEMSQIIINGLALGRQAVTVEKLVHYF